MQSFWNKLPEHYFILAPMEAVTDIVFRHVIASACPPDVFFTEFTNTHSYCNPKGIHSTKGRLTYSQDEQPIVAHIWGDEPEYFENMAIDMKKLGFAGIDINMGCPAPNVAPKGKGSGLIKRPDTTAEIIAATKKSGLPVSVKTRLGYSSLDETEQWITHLLQQDVANLTVHLRTRKEMSKVPAHHEMIDTVLKLRDKIAPQTLITINGDIKNREHGLELIKKHPGINGIMIGRGVFNNPFAFADNKRYSKDDLIGLLKIHLDLYDKYQGQTKRPYETLKRFFKIYIRDFDSASELRDKLMHTKSTNEVRKLLTNL